MLAALFLFAAVNAGLLIDNFDGSKKLQHWSFSNGAEFPGASGKLSVGPGHPDHGAILDYRFTCPDRAHCGSYVAATWQAPSPLNVNTGTVLSLWARFPADVRLTVRVTDQSGQTLQFHANAPSLEYRWPDMWQEIAVPITTKTPEHWGGANTGQLQGRLTQIAVLADSRYPHPAKGQLLFDELRLIDPTETRFRLTPAARLIPAPEDAKNLLPRLGINIHSLQDDHALDIAKEAGFRFVRTDLDPHNFAPADALMRSLESRGMSALWVLRGNPEEDAAAVSHFREHHARFEIWNEPNEKRSLANPSAYPGLLSNALEAIRRQNATVPVTTGGTAGVDLPFLASLLDSGAARNANAVAIHPYRDAGPETLASDLPPLRRWNLPVWITEWGYSAYGNITPNRQGVLAVREVLTGWALGLPLMVWYDLRDDGADPSNREHNFGLLHQDNSEKPAMKAIRTLTSWAADHTYAGLVRDVPYGLHAMRLDGANDFLFVVWNDGGAGPLQIQLAPDALLSVNNLFGEPIALNQDTLLPRETIGPIYIRWKKPKS